MKQRSNNPKTSRKTRTKAKTAGATKMKSKATDARGGTRCAACGKKFQAYAPQHNYCSPACRQRAFYWDYKERTGKRYASRHAGRPAARRSTRRGAATRARRQTKRSA